jgi:hypothetical protein
MMSSLNVRSVFLNDRAYAVVYPMAGFACGSKVLERFILPNFYPAGKNLEEIDEKYRCP